MITKDSRQIGRWVNADMAGLAGGGGLGLGLGLLVLAGSWPASVMMAATAWGVLVVMVAHMVTWCLSLL